MRKDLTQPNEAYANANMGNGIPEVATSPFVCPHPACRVFAEHQWGVVHNFTVFYRQGSVGVRNINNTDRIVSALCTSCKTESVFVNGRLVWPMQSEAPLPNPDMPDELLEDFAEARMILPNSPRGSAALLRLIIQKLLPLIGATKSDINGAIGELVRNEVINRNLQMALDSVRVIGNESVHPGTLDIRDDEAMALSLFNMVNFIVEKAISEPREISRIYATLPKGKIAGIEARDKNPEP